MNGPHRGQDVNSSLTSLEMQTTMCRESTAETCQTAKVGGATEELQGEEGGGSLTHSILTNFEVGLIAPSVWLEKFSRVHCTRSGPSTYNL